MRKDHDRIAKNIESVCHLRRMGVTYAEISKKIGISITRISQILSEHGPHLTGRMPNSRNRRNPEIVKRDACILREYKSGVPIRKIAENMKMELGNVRRIVYENRKIVCRKIFLPKK